MTAQMYRSVLNGELTEIYDAIEAASNNVRTEMGLSREDYAELNAKLELAQRLLFECRVLMARRP